MRVLFVAPFYEPALIYGGMASAPSAWAKALVEAGVSVDVFTTTANGHHELDVAACVPMDIKGVRVTYFPRWRWFRSRFIAPAMYAACVKDTPAYDVVHSVGLWTFPSALSSWAASKEGIPYILSLHGTLMPWAYKHHGRQKRLFMTLIERKRLRLASSVLCSSELERNQFKTFDIAVRTDVIPNVVKPAVVVPQVSRNRFRARYDLQNSVVMLFAGRLVRNKGFDLSIAAFARIVEQHPRACLMIVGPIEDESARLARQQVQEMNLGNKVRFLGILTGDDYWDAIAGSDLFVLNSYSENFGIAPAEALSVGVPVLLSDQVGIAGLVKEYDAGIVTSLDVNEIAEAMASLLTNQDRLVEMGRMGRRLVEDHFSPQVVGRRLKDFFEDITNKTRGQKIRK